MSMNEKCGGLTVETVGEAKPAPETHREIVAANFAEDTQRHDLHVLQDDGQGNRRIIWGRTDSSVDRVEIQTWASNLLMTGDRGTFLFRIWNDDVLPFFNRKPGDLSLDYWAQKVEAADVREFSQAEFTAWVNEEVATWLADPPVPLAAAAPDALREEVQAEVLGDLVETLHVAQQVVYDFSTKLATRDGGDVEFSFPCEDLSGREFAEYTYGYLWACEAIRVVAERYYAHRKQERAAAERVAGTLPRDLSDRVWRVVVTSKPEGADSDAWAPPSWDQAEAFRWPNTDKRFLSRSGAVRRLRLIESYGATGYVQASEPVAWSERTTERPQAPQGEREAA